MLQFIRQTDTLRCQNNLDRPYMDTNYNIAGDSVTDHSINLVSVFKLIVHLACFLYHFENC